MPDSPKYRLTTPAFLFLSLLVGMAACGILSSDDPPELESGPRNYEWSVDSVYSAPGGWMNTIWGSSPDDVWIASGGGYEKLWHFDGKEWTPYSPRFVGDFFSIFGFAQNNVWMGGNDGEIFHYDGESWELFFKYEKQGYNISRVNDIWGTSPSDIYAVGIALENNTPPYTGFILHYNGETWGELLMTDFGIQFQQVRKNNESLYVRGAGPYSTQTISDSISFYKYNNGRISELYSNSRSKTGSSSLNQFGNKLYIVVENEIREVRKMSFSSNLSFSENEIFGVNGRHAKDMFILSTTVVMHYNGVDTRDLFQLDSQNATLWSSLVFENDVFFLVNDYDAGTNLIYHGTLTKEEED